MVVKDGATTGKTGFFSYDIPAAVNEHVFILRAKQGIHPYYLYSMVRSKAFQENLQPFVKGIIGGISLEIRGLGFPLPPRELQQEIVAEIKGYQRVIDGARAVIDNYRPHIPIDPDWPMLELGKVCRIIMGQSPPGKTYNTKGLGAPLINGPVEFGPDPFSKPVVNQYTTAPTKMCQVGDLILCVRGATTGRMNIAGYSGCIGRGVAAIRSESFQPWVNFVINASRDYIYRLGSGSTFPNVTSEDLSSFQIPMPPVATQQAIAEELTREQALVAANRELIQRMEAKIQQSIERVVGPWVIKPAHDWLRLPSFLLLFTLTCTLS